MFYAVEGRLVKKESLVAVVDVSGFYLRVQIPLSTQMKLPETGNRCRLFCELVIGEKSLKLYGFATETERKLFNELRKISKIGPQTALSVLSTLSVEQFQRAVATRDEKTLTSIPGIGKKTALSIIVELSSKLPEQETQPDMVMDAAEALKNMGFASDKASRVVEEIYSKKPDISIEGLIKEALKVLGGSRN